MSHEYRNIPEYHSGAFRRRNNYFRPTWSEELEATKVQSLVGILLIVLGIGQTFWNEGRAVRIHTSLDEGYRNIILPQSVDVVFEENKEKLILVAGNLKVEDELKDPSYGISIQAVKLRKRVQRYQWYETQDEVPSSSANVDEHYHVTYSYDRGWFEEFIDSDKFAHSLGHHNPEYWSINSTVLTNSRVKIGGFLLGNDLKAKFDGGFVPFTSDERPPGASGIKMHAGLYFHSKDVWNPEVGDYRIQFSYAGRNGEPFTVIGKQSGREIRPYQTENGEELLILHPGVRKVDQVFRAEHAVNRFQSWVHRFVGWLISFIGFSCIGSILEILVDDYPIVRTTMSLGFANLSFSFSACITLITIGFSWVIYRPLLGFTLFIIALSPFFAAGYQFNQRRIFLNNHRLS